MDKDLYDLPPEELKKIPTVCGSLREALESLDKDRAFLKAGGVFDDDFIDSYIELKPKCTRFEHTPHPVEFEMYDRARDRREASRSLPRRRHQPRRHQRRSGQGPVGIPDLRQGLQKAADEMWMARYLLQRLTEKYGIDIEYHCKPLGDTDWNGSGMHANFSTTYMREVGGKAYFEALMEAFE
jgi:glutamine synthetase